MTIRVLKAHNLVTSLEETPSPGCKNIDGVCNIFSKEIRIVTYIFFNKSNVCLIQISTEKEHTRANAYSSLVAKREGCYENDILPSVNCLYEHKK